MRINEILATSVIAEAAPGSFGAQAGVFGRALGQAAMQAMLPGANTGGAGAARTGDPGTASVELSEPVIRQQADALAKNWNTMVADQLRQAGVATPDQLSGSQKQALARGLVNTLHQSLLQNRFGTDFKSLPRWVDQRSQPDAQRTVREIEQGLASILNWGKQPQTPQEQQQQWYGLARAANQASRLVTFNPNQASMMATAGRTARSGATDKPPPKITVAPTGQYRLGDQVLDPRNPADAAVIAKIQAATQS
jgi:hypothetical protein